VKKEASILFRRHYFFKFIFVDRATVDADSVTDRCLKSSVAVLAQERCLNLRVLFKNGRALIHANNFLSRIVADIADIFKRDL